MKMAHKGATTITTAAAQSAVARPLLMRRRRLWLLAMHPRRNSARGRPHQQARYRVHDHGEQEECQPDLDQRAQVKVVCSFGEFISDDAGQRVSGSEQ